jgi:cysteine-rich repeat protein
MNQLLRIGGICAVLVLSGCLDVLSPVDGVGTPCTTQADCPDDQTTCHRGYCLETAATQVCNYDGELQAGEACDDGNRIDTDACTNDCQPAVCGDAIVRTDLLEDDEGYEACDDGNDSAFDDCTAICVAARCGDGITKLNGEDCDDANSVDTDDCLSDCTQARCGDGILWNRVEFCDDGNAIATDACTNLCEAASCGDGVARTELPADDPSYEACDDGNLADTDGCLPDCSLTRCGDGITRLDVAEGEPGYESCDDGNRDDNDICPNNCVSARCGDGVVYLGVEDCDDGNNINSDGCLGTCAEARCGDGVVRTDLQSYEPGYERCDEGDQPSESCWSCLTGVFEVQRSGPCGVFHDGSVWCWGHQGMLSLGADHAARPVPTVGLTQVQQVVGGNGWFCALRRDETVWCWGKNTDGQLGNGSIENGFYPKQVKGLDHVIKLQTGSDFLCALRSDRTLWCWGSNVDGKLGDADSSERQTPEPSRVVGLENVAGFSQSNAHLRRHNCAHLLNGSAWCWGNNDHGQVGNGTQLQIHRRPVQVSHLTDVAQIVSGSDFNCARLVRGQVWCWGNNEDGQLGDGTEEPRLEPVRVGDITTAIDLAVLDGAVCALNSDGVVSCWGNNQYGEIGQGNMGTEGGHARYLRPTVVPGLPLVTSLHSSKNVVCALTADNHLWCWGATQNESPRGDVSSLFGATAQQVEGLSNVVEVALGTWARSSGQLRTNVCARGRDGSVSCLGSGDNGVLGNGSRAWSQAPVAVHELNDAGQIIFAGNSACALRSDDTVWCWGANRFGSLGMGMEPDLFAHRVPNLNSAVKVASTGPSGCALRQDQSVWCWGQNWAGQLGNGARQHSYQPVAVQQLGPTRQITSSWASTCAILVDGTSKCWGSGSFGTLGNGVSGMRTYVDEGIEYLSAYHERLPVLVAGLSGTTDISLGGGEVGCAKVGSSGLCWGGYWDAPQPVTAILVPNNIHLIRTGSGKQVCAVHGEQRTVTCWIMEAQGQTPDERRTVAGLVNVVDFGLGWGGNPHPPPSPPDFDQHHVCALRQDGVVSCWGNNVDGQLGGGVAYYYREPRVVEALEGHRVVRLEVSGSTNCAHTEMGAVWCWGANRFGQIRDGTRIKRPTPVRPTPIELR